MITPEEKDEFLTHQAFVCDICRREFDDTALKMFGISITEVWCSGCPVFNIKNTYRKEKRPNTMFTDEKFNYLVSNVIKTMLGVKNV